MPPANSFASSDLNSADSAVSISDSALTDIHIAPLGGKMVSLCTNARAGETVVSMLGRLTEEARRHTLTPVQANVFCDPALGKHYAHAYPRPIENGLHALANLPFPAAFLGRHDTPKGSVLSARITAIPSDSAYHYVFDERGGVCGAKWETSEARYLLLGALTPPDTAAPRDQQSAAAWLLLKRRLENAGFTLGNLVRTWFFNDHILDWYGEFNRVRNGFFNENNIFGTLVPASTGVGASNASGAALSLDALAIAPKKFRAPNSRQAPVTALHIQAITSPLQCAAYDYKSAFSRAVECAPVAGGVRHLLVSGTASIEPGGKTVHHDDLDAQIDLSLRVVEAILKSRGMDWSDTARAILYFPKIEWMSHWETRRVAMGLPDIPGIFAHCDICRDDLLFEIEMDAGISSEANA